MKNGDIYTKGLKSKKGSNIQLTQKIDYRAIYGRLKAICILYSILVNV